MNSERRRCKGNLSLQENKAADETGVIAEYLKALEVEKLRGLMNGILNGADVPKEWKESRVKFTAQWWKERMN